MIIYSAFGLLTITSIVRTGSKMFFHSNLYLLLVSKECKRPEDPKNGEKYGSDFSVGKRVRYTCDTGFVLQGASEIKCLNNRTWSSGVPSCKGKHKNHGFAHTNIYIVQTKSTTVTVFEHLILISIDVYDFISPFFP